MVGLIKAFLAFDNGCVQTTESVHGMRRCQEHDDVACNLFTAHNNGHGFEHEVVELCVNLLHVLDDR